MAASPVGTGCRAHLRLLGCRRRSDAPSPCSHPRIGLTSCPILDRIKRGAGRTLRHRSLCERRSARADLADGFPIEDEDGTIIGASKIARDITEQKRADEGPRQQREWLRVTLASIGDAVITTDTAGRVTFLNPVAEA